MDQSTERYGEIRALLENLMQRVAPAHHTRYAIIDHTIITDARPRDLANTGGPAPGSGVQL